MSETENEKGTEMLTLNTVVETTRTIRFYADKAKTKVTCVPFNTIVKIVGFRRNGDDSQGWVQIVTPKGTIWVMREDLRVVGPIN